MMLIFCPGAKNVFIYLFIYYILFRVVCIFFYLTSLALVSSILSSSRVTHLFCFGDPATVLRHWFIAMVLLEAVYVEGGRS